MSILITGSSGFLGRQLINYFKSTSLSIICLIHSEHIYCQHKELFENCKVYKGDISNKEFLETLFTENEIDYIINCAAMKYIDTCEDFIRESIDVNLTGTLNIVDLSKKYKIKSLVHISTDKSNNATSVYGCCKQIAKKYVLKMGYNTYEGVNFWNSDGSFITHWKNNLELNKPIVLNNSKIMRYFSLIDDVVKDIEFALEDNKNINYLSTKIYKIH